MRYLSVCSGIEAASVAWGPLGWEAAGFSEIDPFANAVLAHHYPGVKNHGDFTKIEAGDVGPINLLVGGTPCQSFSVAGQRAGLDDPRGNLTLEFFRLAGRLRPKWVVWENVPGVLSIDRGRTFGAVLGALGQLGYGFAYAILDAQHFGVPQRRRRVFVVGYLGDWRPAAAILFERQSLSGDSPPRREAGQRVAGTLKSGANRSGGTKPPGSSVDNAQDLQIAIRTAQTSSDGNGGGMVAHSLRARANASFREDSDTYVAMTLNAGGVRRLDGESQTFAPVVGTLSPWAHPGGLNGQDAYSNMLVTHSLRADGHDASEDGTGRGTPIVAFDTAQITSKANRTRAEAGLPTSTLNGSGGMSVATNLAVRRLTPRECERLQGFPDDYTLVPYRKKMAADGPRYKAIGNSMAVPVMRWIAERVEAIEALDNAATINVRS